MSVNDITKRKERLEKLVKEIKDKVVDRKIINEIEKEKMEDIKTALATFEKYEKKIDLGKKGEISRTLLEKELSRLNIDSLKNISTDISFTLFKDKEISIYLENDDKNYMILGHLHIRTKPNSGYIVIGEDGDDILSTYSSYIPTGFKMSDELYNLLQEFKEKVSKIDKLKREADEVLENLSQMRLLARKGLTGYYEFAGKIYKFDFSSEFANPVVVDSIPDDAEFSNSYSLISLSDEEIYEFERELKEFLTNLLEEDEEDVSDKIINFISQKLKTSAVPSLLHIEKEYNEVKVYGEIYYLEPTRNALGGLIKKDFQLLKTLHEPLSNVFEFTELPQPRFFLIDDNSYEKIDEILSKYLVIELDEFQERHKLNTIVHIHSIKDYNLKNDNQPRR